MEQRIIIFLNMLRRPRVTVVNVGQIVLIKGRAYRVEPNRLQLLQIDHNISRS